MSQQEHKGTRLPYGKIGIIALESFRETGKKVDQFVVQKRRDDREKYRGNTLYIVDDEDSYLIDIDNIRFSNGEGKAIIKETMRGRDVYILSDIGNYSCTYDMFGFTNHMGPDEHFQDIKRTVSAIGGQARRITVIMPLLYASRQDRRKGRESLDCAMALQELERIGVKSVVTFDAHEPKVQNSIPLIGFDSLHSTYGLLKGLIQSEMNNLTIDSENMIVISPDSGAMDRAIYFASVLEIDVGMFYKRRDYSKVINGTNPIVQHEYMGADVEGKDILIVDDMIASGGSVFDLLDELKFRKAKNVYVCVTFAFFTAGLDKFNDYYNRGLFKKVFSTNLSYIPENLNDIEWFHQVDMSKHIAHLIHRLNFQQSTSSLFDATGKIRKLLEKKNIV